MAKLVMYSKRLDRDFEMEVCEPRPGQIVGDGSDITIVRAAALEQILIDELAGAVTYTVTSRNDGAIIVEVSDDTGVHVVGIGDIASRSLTTEIAKKYPVSTAYSRAIASAVIKYLGFEGRVYSDASFEVEKESLEGIEEESKKTSKEDSKEIPEDIAEDTPEEAPVKKQKQADKSDEELIWPFGKYKGKSLKEITEKDMQYLEFCYQKVALTEPLKTRVKEILDGNK